MLQSISFSIIVQCDESFKFTTAICVSVIQSWRFFILICSDMLQVCYDSQKGPAQKKRVSAGKAEFSLAIIKPSQKHITSIHLHDSLKKSHFPCRKHSTAASPFPDFHPKTEIQCTALPTARC